MEDHRLAGGIPGGAPDVRTRERRTLLLSAVCVAWSLPVTAFPALRSLQLPPPLTDVRPPSGGSLPDAPSPAARIRNVGSNLRHRRGTQPAQAAAVSNIDTSQRARASTSNEGQTVGSGQPPSGVRSGHSVLYNGLTLRRRRVQDPGEPVEGVAGGVAPGR